MPLRAATDDLDADAIITAWLFAATWDQPPSCGQGETAAKTKFKSHPIGFFHIDLAKVRIAEGRLYMFVAIDRTSKFAFVELHREAKQRTAGDFLRRLIEAVPHKLHTVLTGNGILFTTPGAGGSAIPFIREAMANSSAPTLSSSPAPNPISTLGPLGRPPFGRTAESNG